MTSTRRMDWPGTTECQDGTICEHRAACVPHPSHEGKYMCDCAASPDAQTGIVKYAGLYCEHEATAYCERGNSGSAHAFCTNGGECKLMVGRKEEHAGCKCLPGYEGNYCQFVEGSVPSDWTYDNFMHPALVNAYNTSQPVMNTGSIVALAVLSTVAFCLVVGAIVGGVYGYPCKDRLRRNEKEMDTAGTGEAPGPSPKNADFIGGKSVYRKKNSTGHFVTADTLEADGGVLKEALGEGDLAAESMDALDEVDLDAPASGELA